MTPNEPFFPRSFFCLGYFVTVVESWRSASPLFCKDSMLCTQPCTDAFPLPNTSWKPPHHTASPRSLLNVLQQSGNLLMVSISIIYNFLLFQLMQDKQASCFGIVFPVTLQLRTLDVGLLGQRENAFTILSLSLLESFKLPSKWVVLFYICTSNHF